MVKILEQEKEEEEGQGPHTLTAHRRTPLEGRQQQRGRSSPVGRSPVTRACSGMDGMSSLDIPFSFLGTMAQDQLAGPSSYRKVGPGGAGGPSGGDGPHCAAPWSGEASSLRGFTII